MVKPDPTIFYKIGTLVLDIMKLFQTKVLVSAWAKSLFKNKKKHPGLDSTNCPSQYLKVKVLVEQVNLLVNRKRQLAQAVMIL